jgi:mediator of RNA polymerase II transcription subunit 6
MSNAVAEGKLRLQLFREPDWLATCPLTAESIMDYFSLSPFYDRTSDNQVLRMQGINDPQQLLLMTGIQYEVVKAVFDPRFPDKSIFVIHQQTRHEPRGIPTVTAVFYCVDGTFYQAPTLGQVFDARMVCTFWTAFSSSAQQLVG